MVVGRRARLMIAMVRWWFRDRGELPFALELRKKSQDFVCLEKKLSLDMAIWLSMGCSAS